MPQHRREHWVRFKAIDFEMAPVDVWPKLRQDLLEFEMSFACHQHDIGMVNDFWFDIDMPSHVRVHHQPREFNARQREWVAKEIDELVRCGVVCRAEKVRCAANLVLVEGQQSGQSYHVCYNAIDINT